MSIISDNLVQPFDAEGHIIICGWSPQGRRAVEDLGATAPQLGITIVADAGAPPTPSIPTRRAVTYLQGDPTDRETLQQAGVDASDVIVIIADRCRDISTEAMDARTILTALTIRELDASAHLIAEISREPNEQLAVDAGVDETVMADRFSGVMLSQALQSPGLSQVFSSLFATAAGAVLERQPVPDELVGLPYSRAIAEGPKTGLGAVVGIQRDDELHLPPAEELELSTDDNLVVIRRI